MARHRPHLFVPGCGDGSESLALDAAAVRHLEQVLRLESGEVSYTDGDGLFGTGLYRDGHVVRGDEIRKPRPTRLTVAVAPPRTNSRVRFLVEKLGEIGVRRLVWLRTAHGEGRPPKPEKARRWAASALEQSRGAWLMRVSDGQVSIADLAAMGSPVFADAEGTRATEIVIPEDPVLCVGPEGGFAPEEIPEGALLVSLGPTILRIETAAITGAAILSGVAE